LSDGDCPGTFRSLSDRFDRGRPTLWLPAIKLPITKEEAMTITRTNPDTGVHEEAGSVFGIQIGPWMPKEK